MSFPRRRPGRGRRLVDPADLAGWWCDSAQVEERPGGRYAFGGKHAYGGEASAEITAWEPPSLLEFRWPLGGVDTTVRYELEESMDETVINVVQSAAAPPGTPRGPGMPSWWWVAIPALRSHLAKGKADLRIDWTARAKTFSATVPVSTFPWIIWWKLTDPRELERWWARRAEVDPVPGGAFRLGLESMEPGARPSRSSPAAGSSTTGPGREDTGRESSGRSRRRMTTPSSVCATSARIPAARTRGPSTGERTSSR